jgi:hypothetical protein
MKNLRLGATEIRLLHDLDERVQTASVSLEAKDLRTWNGLIAKLNRGPDGPGGALGPIETALLARSDGKAVKLVTGYARASKVLGNLGVTVEQMGLVGRWIANQTWLKGPVTVLDVLAKWPTWLSKATAESHVNPGQGPDGTSSRASRGRTTQGFR